MANMENPNRKIKLKNIVLNCGGVAEKLERAVRLLELVSGLKAKKTLSKRRIPSFGIRPGLEIGCKVTISDKKAAELLKRLFPAVNNQINDRQVGNGSAGFGIQEYIEIPGLQFQRNIGIMGFDVAINLARAGFSIKDKKRGRSSIPARHRISKEETIKFIEENFNVKVIRGKK